MQSIQESHYFPNSNDSGVYNHSNISTRTEQANCDSHVCAIDLAFKQQHNLPAVLTVQVSVAIHRLLDNLCYAD